MAKFEQKNDFSAGTNLDLDSLRIPENAVVFFKNLTQNVNTNAGAAALAGSNKKITTPVEGNALLPITLASGTNYCIGTYSAEQVNEMYFFVYNNSNNHSIWVVRGNTGVVQKVYQSNLLNFRLEPQYFISQGRCTLELSSYVDPQTGVETNFKFLIFTDNFNEPRFISVEDSIATSSYTLPAPYFAGAGAFYIQDTLITLGVPLPIQCIGIDRPTAYVPIIINTGIGNSKKSASGIGYAINNEGTISGGSPLASYRITGVNGVGGVISYILLSIGGGYSISAGVSTSSTSGTGTGFKVDILSLMPADSELQNSVIRKALQFREKWVDVFWRESEHGIISSQYITIVGGGCITTSNGLPRCFNLSLDAGGPLVNFIQIEVREWIDGTTPVEGDWQLYDTIAKWDNSGGLQWYDRIINPELDYNDTTNRITYTYCGDRQTTPLPTSETSRTENGLARWCSSLQSINKRLLLANNMHGFQPIDPIQLSKISISAKDSDVTSCDASPLRKIVVFANIYSGGTDSGLVRRSHSIVVWGNADSSSSACSGVFALDQVFGDQDNPGFIAYMAGQSGSAYNAVTEQGDYNPLTGAFTVVGYGSGISFSHVPCQRITMTVPAGKYLLRWGSHKAKITDANFQQTSTYVAGLIQIGNLTDLTNRTDYAERPFKELEINCTCRDVVLDGTSGIYGGFGTDPIFIIIDTSIGGSVVDGYLYEQNSSDIPVEMNPVFIGGTTAVGTDNDAFGSFYTDHNGFYFATSGFGAAFAEIFANFCNGAGTLSRLRYVGPTGTGIKHGDGTGTPTGVCPLVSGFWGNRVYLTTSPTEYSICARRYVNQRIALCSDHTVGVPGIPVLITNSAYGLTSASGSVTIVLHNRYTYSSSIGGHSLPFLADMLPDFGANPDDLLILSQRGGCQWTACSGSPCGPITSGCVPSVADVTVFYIGCCPSIMDCNTCRTTNEGDVYVNSSAINIKGIQSGGKYPVSIILHDELGRHTFAQHVGYVTAANLNDSGYRKFSLQSIAYSIDPTFAVPSGFKYMTFAVGKNILFGDFFSWGADWVQFIDNTGQTNNVNPTAIRIYYTSLVEYNKAYGFSTETNWQFSSTDQNGNPLDTPQQGDVVEFIMNGNGVWINSVHSSPVTYNKGAAFFVIDFAEELRTLTNGCLFRVLRPNKLQSGDGSYYEQCLTINLNTDGQVPSGMRTGVLPYFDSYMLSRLLPVPIFAGQTRAIPPGGSPVPPLQTTSTGLTDPASLIGAYAYNNQQNSNAVIIRRTEDSPVSFPFYFESPSPSDFWGNHVANRGRIFIVNPYERQERFGTEVALSDAISDGGSFNGLGYFENIAGVTTVQFDRNAWGAITAVLVETSIAMVICNSDHFLTRYNQSQLRTDVQGNVVSQNTYGLFTAPERKHGQNFGCVPANINTIARYAGTVVWLDAKGHLIYSNFSEALPMEMAAGYQGYLLNKIATNNISNQNPDLGQTYFIGAMDPKTMEYFLTSFNIPFTGAASYINTQSNVNLNVNETMVFDLTTGIYKGSPSFTAEYYGMIPGYFSQKNFLSFKGGKPYLHHATLAASSAIPLFANFYGVQCPCRLTVVCNVGPEKVKRFFSVAVTSREGIFRANVGSTPIFFSDVIKTEKNQVSRLKKKRWVAKDGVWYSEFLCNLLTPVDPNLPTETGVNVLLDGDPLQGRWISVSLVTQDLYAGEYFEVTSVIISGNGVEKSG